MWYLREQLLPAARAADGRLGIYRILIDDKL